MTGAHESGTGGSRSGRLPIETTTFVGREQLISSVLSQLRMTTHLLTLTGAGGVGKTRLAVHIAELLTAEMPARFVDLTRLAAGADLPLVVSAVASALDVADHSVDDVFDRLAEHVSNLDLLLVVDNAEHVIEASATVLAELLRASAGLRVIVTSREPLRIRGEVVLEVPPMTLGEAGEARQLLEDRGREVLGAGWSIPRESEETAQRLCDELDGLPLAIELAAARLRAMSLEVLLSSLSDRFAILTGGRGRLQPYHARLSSTIGWSYEGCSPVARTLWARASVFPASWDLPALKTVCIGDNLAEDDVLSALIELVDKSVVRAVEDRARWRMLDSIREYGVALLSEAELAKLRERHRNYYLEQAEIWSHAWFSPEELSYIDGFYIDLPNVRQALNYSLNTPGEAVPALRMVIALVLSQVWFIVGATSEGIRSLRQALALEEPVPPPLRVLAQTLTVWLTALQGDGEVAASVLEQAEAGRAAIPETDLDPTIAESVAGALDMAAGTYMWLIADSPDSVTRLLSAHRHFKATGDRSSTFMALLYAGLSAAMESDSEVAQDITAQCVELAAAGGADWSRAWANWLRGLLLRWSDPASAESAFKATMEVQARIGDGWGYGWSLESLLWMAAALKQYDRAAQLQGAADAFWRRFGLILSAQVPLYRQRRRVEESIRVHLKTEDWSRGYQYGRTLSRDQVTALALGTKDDDAAVPQLDHSPLSQREWEVALLVGEGRTNQQIANRLYMSLRTVKTHLEHIFGKLNVTSRAQVAAWATQRSDPHPAAGETIQRRRLTR